MNNDCWNQIGVYGDGSCTELQKVIHCRNCPVYSAAGRSLLEREVPLDYLNERTAVLAETQPAELLARVAAIRSGRTIDTVSALVFRLGNERFALNARVLQEITHLSPIHTLPHRTNDLLLGLVNIRGEIILCASLSHLLSIETASPPSNSKDQRLLVVGHKERSWVFPVDEVYRIHRFHTSELEAVPVVIAKANETYTQGVIDWYQKKVNYLDTELLFETLERRII